MIIIYIIFAIIACAEIATYLTFGGFVNRHTSDVYMNLDEEKLRLNTYNPSILSTPQYITNVPFSILVKYRINELGTVPRWSKLHRKIEHYFAVAAKKEIS